MLWPWVVRFTGGFYDIGPVFVSIHDDGFNFGTISKVVTRRGVWRFRLERFAWNRRKSA